MVITNLDCLESIISIFSCPEVDGYGQLVGTPSIYNITQLPGLSLEAMDKIADTDYHSYYGLYTDIIKRAALRLSNDLPAIIPVELNGEVWFDCIGRIKQNLDGSFNTIVGNGNLAGVMLGIRQSKFLTLQVRNIYFHSPVMQTINFMVIEVASNDVLGVYTKDCVIGTNTLEVGLDIPAGQYQKTIAIVYDTTNISFYETESKRCYKECNDCGCECIECNGLNGVEVIDGVFERQYNTYGISVDFSAFCDFNNFICQNRQVFAPSMFYASFIEFYYETLGSSRLNKFTKTNASNLEKIYTNMEKDYMKSLENLSKKTIFNDSCCFKCDETKASYGYKWSNI